jgi:hypothetical protein
MGTIRYATGEIIFDPPLQADELRRPELAPFLDDSRTVRLVVDTKTVETDEGILTKRWSDVIAPHDSGYVNLHLPEHLAELVALINGMVDPNYGERRSFSRSRHIEVYRDVSGVADFEAYRLHVRPSDDGPAVYRTDGQVVWQDTSPQIISPRTVNP